MITYISLFSGVGGFDLGFDRAGMACQAQVEFNPKASAVLQHHWPNIKRFKDVRDVGKHNLPTVDVLCGGFPCQDVSMAGNRAGLNGKRSTLWTEFARIIRETHPGWVVVENVSGLLSSDDGQFFGNILRDLASNGYDAEWDLLPAYIFGASQNRERLYLVAYCQSASPEAIVEQGRVREPSPQFGRFFSHSLRTIPREWEDEPKPSMVRVAHGISDELDTRITQMGNAVIPQIAEWIGQRIVAVEWAQICGLKVVA